MKRIEIIFSQALREDLLEWVEAASKDLSPKEMNDKAIEFISNQLKEWESETGLTLLAK